MGVLTKELDGFEEMGALSFNLVRFDTWVVYHSESIIIQNTISQAVLKDNKEIETITKRDIIFIV